MTRLPADPRIGTVIDGRYEVLERVGEGGMGVVYKARQVSIDRVIAIKMMNKDMAQDPDWVERFYNEARACSRLQHPNTIRMFDFGQTREGSPFMTMEYLDGHSLREAIAATAPMSAVRVLKILIQCCASLAEAHSYDIIHRDMKPDNVFLLDLAGSPDFVKVLDFSVAKLMQSNRLKTRAGVVFGTPQYMSPEQCKGSSLDPRSDLYGLGVLGYEMLTGDVPFDDVSAMNVLQMHILNPVPPLPPAVPQAMRDITMRALAKDPSERFQSAEEMMQACQRAFAQLGAQIDGASAMSTPAPSRSPLNTDPMAHFGAGQSAPSHAPAAQIRRAPAEAKTMMASDSALAERLAPPREAFPAAAAKTVLASQADASMTSPPGAPPSMMGAPPIASYAPPMPAGQSSPGLTAPPGVGPNNGPAKTMMLQDSSGVVSFTGSGIDSRSGHSSPGHPVQSDKGPGILFWAISLCTGVVLGIVAYLILVQLRG